MDSITKDKYFKYLFESIGVLLIFVVWIIGSCVVDNDFIIPSVSKTFDSLINLFKDINTYKIILFTVLRVVISIILGFFIGGLLGILSALFKWFRYLISPIIKLLRSLPVASIILIILIIFRNDYIHDFSLSPIIISMLIVVPLIYEAFYKGITNIDKRLVDVLLLDSSSKYDLIRYTYIPLIKNEIKIALSQSIGLSFKSMVMAEYISSTSLSIGYSLYIYKSINFDYSYVFSWSIVLIVLSIIFEYIGLKLINNEK